jgi:D-alanyl-D-alanine carboxypeptidase/D-alanyl-D-alanine-endopeptidase (penicillin-binding protein 4)
MQILKNDYFSQMLTLFKKIGFLILWVGMILLQSCSVQKQIVKDFSNEKTHPYFSGLMVYNPASKQTLISYNVDKYFTPASTVKLFTLYTSLHFLPDSIATISYFETADTLFIKPLADPSFLHDSLPNTTYDFLFNQKKPISIVPDNFSEFVYGNGWQWDDYQFYYMPELSLFPIYGNVALLNNQKIIPNYFQSSLNETKESELHRDFFDNTFYYNSSSIAQNRKIPFKTSLALSAQLLSDTLHKPVNVSSSNHSLNFKPYKSTPIRPLYSRLMNESENFMAEHLFLTISKEKTDTYKISNAIQLALDSLFTDIPQMPRWVDASGLSRYNLFTPQSMVYILDKLQSKMGQNEIIKFMPKNGKAGSLDKWYPAEHTFLYAKTGSVSNNHNLCGYLISKKGTFLIFSYMNNNFTLKSSEVRTEMNQVLLKIYNNY